MTSRIRDLVILFALPALLLPACGPADVEQPETVKVRAALQAYVSFAPYFIALEEGFFAEQGLEVEFVQFEAGPEMVPALVRGEIDVAAGGLSGGLLNAIARGENIRIVADKGHIAPEGCTYVASVASAGLAEELDSVGPSALAGKKIASVAAGLQTYYTSHMLRKFGLSMEDVEMVNLPNRPLLGQQAITSYNITHVGDVPLGR